MLVQQLTPLLFVIGSIMGPVQVSPVESVTYLAHRKKRGRGSESVPLMFLLLTRVRSHLDECVLADQTGSYQA
jgi:hypothetical protein